MRELRARVMLAGAVTTALLAGVALALGGPAAGLGVVAAGGITLLNFWWLVRNATGVLGTTVAPRRGLWMVVAGLRFFILTTVLVSLLASGIVHPIAFVAGLGIVPVALIVLGLSAANRSEAC